MKKINETKFYQALENIFTGANIEGDSGYVNLLKIKSQYYKLILEQFKKEVDEDPIITDSFKEEFFDKLYSFFERYFSESGSVYFVKTANWQRVYEQVYTDNKDVVLFWKTHMLYYVKSDILFQSLDVEIEDEETQKKYNFFFDVGNLQNKQNNEKKHLVFTFREIKEEETSEEVLNNKQGKKVYVFDVAYSENGRKTKIDDIVKKTKIPENIIEKAFRTFKKQSEVDFFINKNAEKFLTEQLDMYLHQILLNEENKFDQRRLNQLKTIKTFAQKIIKFIAQFEDELVRVWNKPKFVLKSNYIITIDKLSSEIIEKIEKHINLKEQIKEWQELGVVDENFVFEDIKQNDNYKYLPIDTKYFKDLEIEILGLFDNLDEALDGRLIHSENYQALITLQEKYKEKIDTIYIDPPYNSPASEIIYVNNYKHSSWLTLMENRLNISKIYLKKDGIFECAIDDNEQERFGILLDKIFDRYEKTCVTIVHNPSGTQRNDFLMTHEYTYFVYNKNVKINPEKRDEKDADVRNFMNTAKGNTENYKRETGYNCFYPILINKQNLVIIGFGDVCDKNFHPHSSNVDKGDYIEVYPIDNDGIERKWVFQRDKVENIFNELFVKIVHDEYRIYRKKKLINFKSVWVNSKYSAKKYGTELLKNYGLINFDFPKSIYNVYDCLYASVANRKNAIILDFFAGSGTTADAVIRMNKNDNGNRKFILIELGSHFNSVILPRLKKLAVSLNYEKGIPQDRNGNSLFFKYYDLEQYEDTLRNMKYKNNSPTDIFNDKKSFEQYIFFADEKFAHILEVGKDILEVDFDKLYKNIDFAETISNLLGLPIKRITKTSVVLQDGEEEREIKTDYKNMTKEEKLEFVRLLKPLLWWGK